MQEGCEEALLYANFCVKTLFSYRNLGLNLKAAFESNIT